MTRRLFAALACSAATLLPACGTDDGAGRRYPVSGKVSYKGQPVAKGSITFAPEDPNGRAASGLIADGSYRLSTLGDNDGALPGKYKVTVTARDIDQAKVQPAAGRSAINPSVIAKANQAAKNNVPAKYSSSSTSPLAAEVPAKSTSIDFDLVD